MRVSQVNGRTQWLSVSACREYRAADDVYLSGTVQDITRAKEVSINA